MHRLVIEYALDGDRPGYRFAPPTGGIDEETLRTVWQQAMPRGQGWRAGVYRRARSLKCFPVGDNTVALAVTHVTDQQDELGRGGIRRAEISLLTAAECLGVLEERLAAFPPALREAAGRRVARVLWRRLLDRVTPRLRGGRTVVLTHPYTTPEAWQVIELLVLRLVTSPTLRMIEGWGAAGSFTTLALDWRDESRIVALPLDAARRLGGTPVIPIP